MKRHKTKYPGVFIREAERIDACRTEKIFHVVYKRNGKTIEAKAGRQYADDRAAAGGNQYRTAPIEGRASTSGELEAACRA